MLSRGDRGNLNLRAALLHVAGDLLGSVAAIAAALVILWTGWTPIDPILSVLRGAPDPALGLAVVRDSAHILLEGTPAGFDAAAIAADLARRGPGVAAVRHLHAWSITEARPMVTLEAVIAPGADAEAARRAGQGPPRRALRLRPRHRRDPAPSPPATRQLPAPAPRAYLGALIAAEGPPTCRSRSPRPCPPTTCSGARA